MIHEFMIHHHFTKLTFHGPALYIKLLSCHSTGGRLQWQAPASVTRQPEAVYLLELVRTAGAPRQRVVARVLEDGLRHLPPPLDGAVQALVPVNNVIVSRYHVFLNCDISCYLIWLYRLVSW